jgi:anti-sigma factor (TIGR02949 family)
MNCQEALKHLYEVIDHETSEIDEDKIREHFKLCHHCRGIYNVELALNDFIKARLHDQSTPEHLDTLRTKVVAELDRVDCGS